MKPIFRLLNWSKFYVGKYNLFYHYTMIHTEKIHTKCFSNWRNKRLKCLVADQKGIQKINVDVDQAERQKCFSLLKKE